MDDPQKIIADSKHPNSPIHEVVFEIRFPGETTIECKRHEIQRKIRNDYPNLFVPAARNGVHLALEPYQFARKDNSASVMIALNRFSYSSKSYPGFKVFKKECMRVISIFNKIVRLEELNRIGLRYINIIPFLREDTSLPMKRFFNFVRPLEDFFESDFLQFSNHVSFPLASGIITIHTEVIEGKNSNREAFLLDMDYARVNNLNVNNIETYLEEAHDISTVQFNKIITKDHYEYIRVGGI